jgi:hypothetical protein
MLPGSSLTSSIPSTKAPTTAGPTQAAPLITSSAPTKSPSTENPTPTDVAPLIGSSAPSEKPTPTPTFNTASPSKQSLLTTGSDAFAKANIQVHIVAGPLYVRQEWKKNFENNLQPGDGFLVHLGSATPSGDCSEEAYNRTERSLSFSPVTAFSLPGNDDYPVS